MGVGSVSKAQEARKSNTMVIKILIIASNVYWLPALMTGSQL